MLKRKQVEMLLIIFNYSLENLYQYMVDYVIHILEQLIINITVQHVIIIKIIVLDIWV